MRPRIIPTLLLRDTYLVKGINFLEHKYVGDPINAVRIFSKMEVDELFFLDIDATNKGCITSLEFIKDIADECFMPFAVGGGIEDIYQVEDILKCGAEKVVINTSAYNNTDFISEASAVFGSQAIVVSVDVNFDGEKYNIHTNSGKVKRNRDLQLYIEEIEVKGAGEILLNSIHHDGLMNGFDTKLINNVSNLVNIPVIASGGCWKIQHIEEALNSTNIHSVSAASMFVFKGSRDGVLINYPSKRDLDILFERLS